MQIGDYRLEIIPDTEFRLDGGAMFGVVPRVLWERVCPPDELNRIRMNMNCVFLDTGKDKIIIETGIGEKWTEKQIAMYSIHRERSLADRCLRSQAADPRIFRSSSTRTCISTTPAEIRSRLAARLRPDTDRELTSRIRQCPLSGFTG